MLSIIGYTSILVLALFFLGYGISILSLPKKLQPFSIFIAPWIAVVTIIFTVVIFGRIGFETAFLTTVLTIIMSTLTLYATKKIGFPKLTLFDKIILTISALIIFFNLAPMLLQQGFLTTLSLGGNDAKAFATVPDYLMTHTVRQAFEEVSPSAVYTLFSFGWRVGPSIIMSFFQILLGLAGYQVLSIIQAVLFSLAIPLVYVFYKLSSENQNESAALVAASLVGVNVNILYYLYHNFIGQIIFLGLSLLILILLLSYDDFLKKSSRFSLRINQYDLLIGTSLAVLFFSYHEAAVFIIIPMVLSAVLRFASKKISLSWMIAYVKSFLIALLLAFPAIIHAIYFAIFYRTGDFNAPIGWQPFRATGSSFINLFEMTGMYSIHGFSELPTIFVLILSIVVVSFIVYGIKKSRYKILMTSFFLTYCFFFVILILVRPNFWFYDRAIAYAIPVLMTLFILGVASFLERRKYLIPYALVLVLWLSIVNSGYLMRRYWRENLAVDNWMTTLSALPDETKINFPVYSEQVLNPTQPIWKELWAEYFLEPKVNFINSLEYRAYPKKIKDNDLMLVSKIFKYTPITKVLFNEVLWENNYYKLGKSCVSDRCLSKSSYDLSRVVFGKTEYDDTLLDKGWSIAENDSRWVIQKQAGVRLVNQSLSSQLIIESLTLGQPQRMTVFIDGKKIGTVPLYEKWKEYKFSIKLSAEVHTIVFKFSNSYRPVDIMGGFDSRSLSASFKRIELR